MNDVNLLSSLPEINMRQHLMNNYLIYDLFAYEYTCQAKFYHQYLFI